MVDHERHPALDVLGTRGRSLRAGARFEKLPGVRDGGRQQASRSMRTDERNAHANFMSLKVTVLDAGILRDGRELGAPVIAAPKVRRPVDPVAPLLTPMVLALMALETRAMAPVHVLVGTSRVRGLHISHVTCRTGPFGIDT